MVKTTSSILGYPATEFNKFLIDSTICLEDEVIMSVRKCTRHGFGWFKAQGRGRAHCMTHRVANNITWYSQYRKAVFTVPQH